ncbi:MAG: ABC transporter substrate-binding protein [Geminicoccaceae bacterium]
MERTNATDRDAARSSMMPLRRAEFLKLLGGAAFGLAYAVGGTTTALAEGGTLTVGISSDIKTLDPHLSSLDVFRHTIRSTVFEALTFIDPDTLQPVPALAKSWEVAPDNLSVTFKLQDGVKWHDGSAFTAGDVVFTLKRVMDPKTASVLAPQVASVADVTAVDPGTVRVTLKATTPGILANLATVQIVNPKNIDAITTKPIGTGPFKFADWTPGDHIRVERFADYRIAGLPLLEAIEWRIVPDSQARLSGLQDGSLQLVALVEGRDVKQAQTIPDVQIISTKPYVLYEMFNVNTQRAPFSDKRVRQALSYAFDRESYVKTVWFGLARATANPVPPEMPTYWPEAAKAYPFDLAKAEALLAEAGFSKANPLKMEILTPAGFESLKSMALLLQDNLNRIGHQVTVRELEITVWIDTFVTKKEFDITTDNYNTVPEDPAGMFNSSNLAPGGNDNGFVSPAYADLVAKAMSEVDPDKRKALYQDLQKFLLDEMPMITIDHLPLFFLGAPGFSGFVIGPSGIDSYAKVTLGS